MSKNLFSIVLILSLSILAENSYSTNKTNINPNVLNTLSLGLPVVEINTIDEEEPTAVPISHPMGSMGESITDVTKVPGSVTVYSPEGEIIYESGEYIKKESGMTVKIRGNTSSYGTKKPYKIKLQKKGDLLGRGDNRYKDKNWVLIFNYDFKTYMGYHIGLLTGQTWMPEGIFVNLVFNGDFRGLYILQENIERNVDCRINVDEDGFIMEHDPYWWNENGQYLESFDHPSFNYTFKYPDYEDASTETISAIGEVLKQYEQSIIDGTYPQIIDVRSFAQWVLAHDILGTWDGGGVNLYLTKKSLSNETKIQCGPLWDFDSSEKRQDLFSGVHHYRFDKLFDNENSSFKEEFVRCWNDIKDNLKIKVDSIIQNLKTPNWTSYNESYYQDCIRWGVGESVNATEVAAERLSKWYNERLLWLDEAIYKMEQEMSENKNYVEQLNIPLELFSIYDGNLSAKKNIDSVTIRMIDGNCFLKGI